MTSFSDQILDRATGEHDRRRVENSKLGDHCQTGDGARVHHSAAAGVHRQCVRQSV